jgi:hypothetical protein
MTGLGQILPSGLQRAHGLQREQFGVARLPTK